MERNTKQKKLLLKLLRESSRPMSISELHGLLQKEIPNIAKSTVYRNMDSLLGQELVDKYFLNDNEVFYKIKEDRNTHEHYLICVRCNKMYHLPHCPLHDLEGYIDEMGFEVQEHYIQISGVCRECRETAGGKESKVKSRSE